MYYKRMVSCKWPSTFQFNHMRRYAERSKTTYVSFRFVSNWVKRDPPAVWASVGPRPFISTNKILLRHFDRSILQVRGRSYVPLHGRTAYGIQACFMQFLFLFSLFFSLCFRETIFKFFDKWSF